MEYSLTLEPIIHRLQMLLPIEDQYREITGFNVIATGTVTVEVRVIVNSTTNVTSVSGLNTDINLL